MVRWGVFVVRNVASLECVAPRVPNMLEEHCGVWVLYGVRGVAEGCGNVVRISVD